MASLPKALTLHAQGQTMLMSVLVACSCYFAAKASAATMTEAPVGEWKSPISSELIVSQSIRLSSPIVAHDGALKVVQQRAVGRCWSVGR